MMRTDAEGDGSGRNEYGRSECSDVASVVTMVVAVSMEMVM